MPDLQPVFTLLAGVPVALLSAWVTVRLALRRFQSERMFERRIDAYVQVLESMHAVKHYLERQVWAHELNYTIPTDRTDALAKEYDSGLVDLRRYTDLGSVLFSDRAVELLDDLSVKLRPTSGEEAGIERTKVRLEAIVRGLREFRQIARKDLRATT